MKDSVLASRDMAEVMRHQVNIASAGVQAKIEQQHETVSASIAPHDRRRTGAFETATSLARSGVRTSI